MSGWSDGGAFLIKPTFRPGGLATAIGSFPHQNPAEAIDLVFRSMPEVPAWPQLPNRAPDEGMVAQYIEGLPGVVWVPGEKHLFINTGSPTFDEELAQFFGHYLEITEDGKVELLEKFAISEKHAAGFYAFLHHLEAHMKVPSRFLKGQVTGPITFGLGLPDQDGRSSYYNDQLRQAIVKLLGLKARWQVRRLKKLSENIIIFVDEPTLSSFGSSAIITISRENVIQDLNDVIEAVQAEDALAGVHCCGKTDWSLLLSTKIDILSFDAYNFGESLLLYPTEMREFLNRGGIIAWGIVPTSEKVLAESAAGLIFRLEGLIAKVAHIGSSIDVKEFSLITPSCGTGSLPQDLSERIFKLLSEVSQGLRA